MRRETERSIREESIKAEDIQQLSKNLETARVLSKEAEEGTQEKTK